jgi:hypothetical protein
LAFSSQHFAKCYPRLFFLRPREVEVVVAFGAVGVLAAVLFPVDGELAAQDAGLDERADVEADAVVQVWVPADGLLVLVTCTTQKRLPSGSSNTIKSSSGLYLRG